jgi:hypothetical protein
VEEAVEVADIEIEEHFVDEEEEEKEEENNYRPPA